MMNSSTEIVEQQLSKKSGVDVGDSISNIHDDILSNIFSRLPLEDTVRTSILAKYWKYKWASSYKLDIHDRHWEANPHSFIAFLNRTLPSIQCLTTFQLRCVSAVARAEENDFQRWLSAVLEHNLEIFLVKLTTLGGLVLPCALLNSSSLRQLSFSAPITTLKVHVRNIAPKLTHLFLWGVKIVSGNPTLSFTFPVLEKLTLMRHEWLNVKSVEIHAPSLTVLVSQPIQLRNKDYDYSIVIFAPRVTILDCRGIPEKIRVNPSPSSVVSAYLSGQFGLGYNLHIRRDAGHRVLELLNKCTSLEELMFLCCDFVKEPMRAVPLCSYDKLKRLTLGRRCSLKILFEFLYSAPSLKFLCTWVCSCPCILAEMPACVESHLEEVVLLGPIKAERDYYLAKYFFNNAVQLKNLRIVLMNGHHAPKEQVIERLSAMPRRSTSATIDVVSGVYTDGRYDHIWQ